MYGHTDPSGCPYEDDDSAVVNAREAHHNLEYRVNELTRRVVHAEAELARVTNIAHEFGQAIVQAKNVYIDVQGISKESLAWFHELEATKRNVIEQERAKKSERAAWLRRRSKEINDELKELVKLGL